MTEDRATAGRWTPLRWLAILVVGIVAVSWLSTGGGMARIGALLSPHGVAGPAVNVANQLPDCESGQLAIAGGYNDCARRASISDATCAAAPSSGLDAVIRFHGHGHDYLLYIEIDGAYAGKGVYSVRAWPPTGRTAGSSAVAIREYASGALWGSEYGVLDVNDITGSSGSIKADLSFEGGEPTPANTRLSISGSWSCVR